MDDQKQQYDPTTIALHWIVAATVVVQWLLGQGMHYFPKDWKHPDRQIHVYIGTALTVVLLVRLIWRLTRGRRIVEPGSLMTLAAKAMHVALYLVLFTILGLGLFAVWNKGGPYLGGLINIDPWGHAEKAARKALSIKVVGIHELLANILLGLAGLHAAAALVHQYILKDGVLSRMIPALKASRGG